MHQFQKYHLLRLGVFEVVMSSGGVTIYELWKVKTLRFSTIFFIVLRFFYYFLAKSLIILFGVTGIFLYNTLTITEIVVIKTLYLYKYSRIAAMNEYFITAMLTSFNILIIGSNIVIRITLKEYEGNPFYNFLIGQHAEKLEFHKIVNFL